MGDGQWPLCDSMEFERQHSVQKILFSYQKTGKAHSLHSQDFNLCLTQLSKKLPPEAEPSRGTARLMDLSQTPAPPISTPLRPPSPLTPPLAARGPPFTGFPRPDPHLASFFPPPSHLTLASVPKGGQLPHRTQNLSSLALRPGGSLQQVCSQTAAGRGLFLTQASYCPHLTNL